MFHISESLVQFFRLKILKLLVADTGSDAFLTLDPGSGMRKFGSTIRDKHPGSSTLVAPGFTIYVRTFVSILLSFFFLFLKKF